MFRPLFARTVRTALGCFAAALLCLTHSVPSQASDTAYGVYVLDHIAAACGFGAHVRIGRAPVAIAQAIVIDDREAILYNPRSLATLERLTGNPWSAVSVIAHELGHHYYGHSKVGTTGVGADEIHDCELAADYFSGYALARLGASLEDAQTALRWLDEEATDYHPSADERLAAIATGWRDGRDGKPLPLSKTAQQISIQGPEDLKPREPLSLASGRW